MFYAAAILVWSCVALFVATAAITVVALLGIIRLGGGTAATHQYYLKRLFFSLVIQVVVSSVAVYAAYVKGGLEPLERQTSDSIVAMQAPLQGRLDDLEVGFKKLESRIDQMKLPTPSNPVADDWTLLPRTGDCPGFDNGRTVGENPDPAHCTKEGLTAVCWDGKLFKNESGAWCTYKTLASERCTGGSAPGRIYRCSNPEGIRIDQAVWAANCEFPAIDVKSRFEVCIGKSHCEVLMGGGDWAKLFGDPCKGQFKDLGIAYRLNGSARRVSWSGKNCDGKYVILSEKGQADCQ